MTLAERVRHLEEELEYTKAILDGSEAQTREAVVAVVGLLASFLAGGKALDYDGFLAFLAGTVDSDYRSEDHVGQLVHDLRRVMVFHRDLDAGTLGPHVPVSEALSADEIAAIRRRAEAQVALEKAATRAAEGRRPRKGRRGSAPLGH